VKLSVVRGGGLAGIVTRTEVSSDDLPPAKATELDEQIERSGLRALPPKLEPEKPSPDELRYDITVEHAGAKHTVRAADTVLPDGVRDLIAWLDALPQRRETIG
jgi:hypothetical protein